MREPLAGLALAIVVVSCGGAPSTETPPPPAVRGRTPGAALTTDGYARPDSCGGCHRDLAASYRSVSMAQSFRRPGPEDFVEADAPRNRIEHAKSGFIYEMRRDDGRLIQRRFERDPEGRPVRIFDREVTFVIGSGRHARSYLHLSPTGEMTELPVTWYAQERAWGMSPGFDRSDQPDFFRPVTYACLFCHNGYPALPRGADSPLAPQLFPRDLPSGIDCQRCHGPGQRHVDRATDRTAPFAEVRRSIVNPARLSLERQMDICMQCHLETTSSATWNGLVVFGRGVFSFRPGEDLAGYQWHFDHAPEAGRGDKFEIAHQAYRLRQSACFKSSAGRMTCTTCHDPHRRPERPEEYFSSKCLGCHRLEECAPAASVARAAASHAAAGPAEAPGCISCHMPSRRTDDVVHVTMTDHLIRRTHPPLPDRLAPRAEATGAYRGPIVFYRREEIPKGPERDLVLGVASVLDGVDADRGLALLEKAVAAIDPALPEPHFQLGLTLQARGRLPEAHVRLARAADLAPGNARVLLALADALAALGREEEALARYEQSIAAWPGGTEAHTNAGGLLARAGHLSQALARYSRAIALRGDNAQAHASRGAVLARLGRGEEAEAALREALRIDPREPSAATNLATALRARGDDAGAVRALRDGAARNPSNPGLPTRLAFLLATARDPRIRNGREALDLARSAVAATGRKDPRALDALAAALAETGRVAEAVALAGEAGRLAAAQGEEGLAAAIAARRHGYEAGRPYRAGETDD
jgi:Flp pilus assembly protein TadD